MTVLCATVDRHASSHANRHGGVGVTVGVTVSSRPRDAVSSQSEFRDGGRLLSALARRFAGFGELRTAVTGHRSPPASVCL